MIKSAHHNSSIYSTGCIPYCKDRSTCRSLAVQPSTRFQWRNAHVFPVDGTRAVCAASTDCRKGWEQAPTPHSSALCHLAAGCLKKRPQRILGLLHFCFGTQLIPVIKFYKIYSIKFYIFKSKYPETSTR